MRCPECGFNLDNHDPRAGSRGYCDGCGVRFCVSCGCTETAPCVRGDRACAWAPVEQVMQLAIFIGEEPAPTCSFCLSTAVKQLYAQAGADVFILSFNRG